MRARQVMFAGLLLTGSTGGLTGCAQLRTMFGPADDTTPCAACAAKPGPVDATPRTLPDPGVMPDAVPAPTPEIQIRPTPPENPAPIPLILPPKNEDGNVAPPKIDDGTVPPPPRVVEPKRPVELPKIYNGVRPKETAPPPKTEALPKTETPPTAGIPPKKEAPAKAPSADANAKRAADLAKQLDAREAENRTLTLRVKTLEIALENREKALQDDEKELAKSAQDMAHAQAELTRLKDAFVKVKTRLKHVEQEDIDTLKAVIAALEQMVAAAPPGL